MQRRYLNFELPKLLGLLALLVASGCTQPQPQTPFAIAEAQYKNGRWDQAVEMCSRILDTDPDRAEVVSLRARSLGAAGRYNEALDDLTRWVELAPNDSEPLYHRAMAYEKLGQQEMADADQQAAKSMDPLYKRAYAFEIDSAPARSAVSIRPSQSEGEIDDSTEPALDDDSTDMNSVFGSSNSSDDDSQAAREEAIWERVEEHIQRESGKATADVATTSDSERESTSSKSLLDDKPDRSKILDRVAEQLFVPDEPPEFTPEPAAPPQPARPAISSALPTDIYGNPIRPGQALGANPNAPLGTGNANLDITVSERLRRCRELRRPSEWRFE